MSKMTSIVDERSTNGKKKFTGNFAR